MRAFNNFTMSTGLRINPSKCNVFFEGVDAFTIQSIINLTNFAKGFLPLKYLGVSLTCKKLSINHYMHLIDKIVHRIRHWSNNLLSYAGHVQLIWSVTFAIVNYWMQCFPIPIHVLCKIDSICKSFLWTGGTKTSMKSPMGYGMSS